jgi:hypothetical protein
MIRASYRIPYRSVAGEELNDYRRVKLFPPVKSSSGKLIKYLQPSGVTPHVYLPPTLGDGVLSDSQNPLIVTEGEKKALKAVQEGFDCIALGGVDSWHIRTFKVPTAITKQEGKITKIRTENPSDIAELMEHVAPELHDIVWRGRTVHLIYDTDTGEDSRTHILRAAFEFGLWLDGKGARVNYVALPSSGTAKVGLDDFLLGSGSDALTRLLEQPFRFPVPPNIKEWVSHKLSGGRISREIYLSVARGVIAALDEGGARFVDKARRYYYFDRSTRHLHEFLWSANEIRQLRLTSMGTLLNKSYGLGTSDTTAIGRLADRYAGTDPCPEIRPHRTVCTVDDVLYFQLSNSRVAKVSADGIQLTDNGVDDVLFLSSTSIVPVDEEELVSSLSALEQSTHVNGTITGASQLPLPLSAYTRSPWAEALHDVKIDPMPGLDHPETVQVLDVLFHLSPWLRRWRGLMLPVELCVAEPNSGKTFLYNLRRGILTGDASLDNPPNDIRDWYATVSAAPGLWICDNLGEIRKDIRDKLSDEMARLTTDPHPAVELRELFTTSTSVRIPIDAGFAGTAIWNPFSRADILQRSVVYSMREIPPGERDSSWYSRRLARRPQWLASHLLSIHRFFRVVSSSWNDHYLSGHRLVNYEQAVVCMSLALGYAPDQTASMVRNLVTNTQEMIAESEPVFEALRAFVDEWKRDHGELRDPKLQDIVAWANADLGQRFSKLRAFSNTVLLGRYMKMYQHQIERSCGVTVTKVHNVTVLKIR